MWYEVFAFACPAHPLAKAGQPFVGLVQRRFAADSLRSMRAAVKRGGKPIEPVVDAFRRNTLFKGGEMK